MNRTRAPAFDEAARVLGPEVNVAVVGPSSRTWYVDQGVLVEVLLWLEHYLAGVTLVCVAAFRPTAVAAVECSGTCPWLASIEEVDPRLDSFQLCVALPARNSAEVSSASPLVDRLLGRGVPVLALWPDRRASFHASPNK